MMTMSGRLFSPCCLMTGWLKIYHEEREVFKMTIELPENAAEITSAYLQKLSNSYKWWEYQKDIIHKAIFFVNHTKQDLKENP